MFIEKYSEIHEIPGYDEGAFLAEVLANSYGVGYTNWLGIDYDPKAEPRHWISALIGVCMEDRIVASLMDGTAVFLAIDPYWDGEEPISYGKDFDSWQRMIDSPNEEVQALLDAFLEGQDDAETADELLQCWIYGEVILG